MSRLISTGEPAGTDSRTATGAGHDPAAGEPGAHVGEPGPTSVGRALQVLDVVAQAGDGVAAKTIARRLGLSLPTTYRLLATLVEQGYLVRLHEPRGYGLGYRISALHRRLVEQVEVPWSVREVLHDVHRLVGGATCYAVRRDAEVVPVLLDECPDHPAASRLRIGEPAAGHATAIGKVLLAGLDRRPLAAALARPMPALTSRTVVDRDLLFRELTQVRELGVAVEVDESQPRRSGVAAPVRDVGGRVIGAFGVSVCRATFLARRAELERAVRDGAARVAATLAARAEAV
ncbi:MAG: IclR family transcriptional regulator [Pseudonocardia sp.]